MEQSAEESEGSSPTAGGGDNNGGSGGGDSFLRGLFVAWSVRYHSTYASLQEVRASEVNCRQIHDGGCRR